MTISPSLPRIRLEVLLDKGAGELLPEEVYRLSGQGIWLEESNEGTLLKCYPDESEAVLSCLRSAGINVAHVSQAEEGPQDYAALTRRYFRPIRIENITVIPPWTKRRPDRRSIVIDPGMAFGTGRHESTRLMVKLMGSINMEGSSVIDLGCGSAILSLYALLCGAARVVAVDNDLDAVLSAGKNLLLNDTPDVHLVCADLLDLKGAWDVVLANLDIRTFARCSSHVKGFVRKSGYLVISGILGRDASKLISLFPGLQLLSVERRNSWRGFLFFNG
jgi:ribosomal protein L11 methyltransferase